MAASGRASSRSASLCGMTWLVVNRSGWGWGCQGGRELVRTCGIQAGRSLTALSRPGDLPRQARSGAASILYHPCFPLASPCDSHSHHVAPLSSYLGPCPLILHVQGESPWRGGLGRGRGGDGEWVPGPAGDGGDEEVDVAQGAARLV